jgi:hypothetical protein
LRHHSLKPWVIPARAREMLFGLGIRRLAVRFLATTSR